MCHDVGQQVRPGIATVSTLDPTSRLIERLYFALLDRPADTRALTPWDTFYNAHPGEARLRHIADDVQQSVEFHALHHSPSDRQFVEALYEGALGRATEPAALHLDIHDLHHGLTRAALAVSVAESPEAIAHLAGKPIA